MLHNITSMGTVLEQNSTTIVRDKDGGALIKFRVEFNTALKGWMGVMGSHPHLGDAPPCCHAAPFRSAG